MFNWFKRKKDSRMLTTLERIADSLEDIHEHMLLEQESMERDIYKRLKEQFLKEAEKESQTKAIHTEPVHQSAIKKITVETKTQKQMTPKTINPVLQTLEKIGVKIIKHEENKEKYADMMALIFQMGEKFDDIAPFLKHLKASLNSLKKKRICLRNWTDAQISSSCQLALSMYNHGLLDEYKYLKSPIFEMIFQTSRNPDAINFLTGDWLECYVRDIVEKHLRMQQVDYHIAANPIIMMPNGRQFEMDLIIEINDELVWIEIKSGEYKSYLSKYEEVGQLLQIPEENRFLILANEKDAICESLGRSREMNVLNLNMLKRELPAVIRNLSAELVKAG